MNKLVSHISSEMSIPLNWMIFARGMKISKTKFLSTQAALKTNPMIFDGQTLIYQSAKNKDFSWTFL